MTDDLRRLQGVWFPTHSSVEGRPPRVLAPSFPAPRDVWLMTIYGDSFHVTLNAEYHLTGGRLILSEKPRAVRFVCPGLPDEYHTWAYYEVTGAELLMCSRPEDRSKPWYTEYAARYVRVAEGPTPEMLALFEAVMREWLRVGAGATRP